MKQLMMVMNEDKAIHMESFFHALGVEFLEVQGMDIAEKNYQILITPTPTTNAIQELEKGSVCEIKQEGVVNAGEEV